MSDLTIAEIQQEKRNLEKQIEAQLLQFSVKTGLKVERNIDVEFFQIRSDEGAGYLVTIEITI